MRMFTAVLLLFVSTSTVGAQIRPDTVLARKLAQTPVELDLGSLHVVNLYRLQADALFDTEGMPPDSTIARLVRDVYAPYSSFWQGYIGGEANFTRWAEQLLAADHPIHSRLALLLDVDLDRRFTDGVAWIERTTGRTPVGTWYIVFGPGWTNMGGLGDLGMVADFSNAHMPPDSTAIANLLPHELAHQVHGAALDGDPDAGTVLHRIIGEGFASYVAWVYGGGKHSPADALMYDEAEWQWALDHERELFDAVRPLLTSKDRTDLDLVASRRQSILPGAPGASGYFIGFRVVQQYVERFGADSWKELFDMPVGEVFRRATGR